MTRTPTAEGTNRNLARTTTGEALIGTERGFVPLSAADPALETMGDALRVAPGGLPDPGDATASLLSEENLTFTPPFDPGRLLGSGSTTSITPPISTRHRPLSPRPSSIHGHLSPVPAGRSAFPHRRSPIA